MRRRRAEKRQVTPDVKYNSELIARFINVILKKGKKSKAQSMVYTAMENIEKRYPEENPLEIFMQALENVKPLLVLKSRRIGGANYQIPIEIDPDRQMSIALRWITDFARNRKGKSMGQALTEELLDAYNNTGASVKKKDEIHRMAQANRAFAHYRW